MAVVPGKTKILRSYLIVGLGVQVMQHILNLGNHYEMTKGFLPCSMRKE